MGLSKVNYGRVMHLISSYCGSTAVLLSAHQSIGVPQPLLDFGTEEQKKKFLPRFRKDAISGFALTEPGAGSDPSKMTTTATPVEDGKYFLLNGEKLWCTNGVIADILIVMALTPPKMVMEKKKNRSRHLLWKPRRRGLKSSTVANSWDSRRQDRLLKFNNVKVPARTSLREKGKG